MDIYRCGCKWVSIYVFICICLCLSRLKLMLPCSLLLLIDSHFHLNAKGVYLGILKSTTAH